MTSCQSEDDILEREARINDVTGVIRGAMDDVRSRYLALSQITRCDYLVRVTGDNPFTDFRAIKPLLSEMIKNHDQYLWLDPSCCPDGINLELFTPHLLTESIKFSNSSEDLEHVTPWMRNRLRGNGLWLNWYAKSLWLPLVLIQKGTLKF